MKSAIGYVRVSTEGQAVDGVSLDAQRARIAAWCAANGNQLAALHVDAGLSGKRADNRPGLQAALDAVRAERGAALVVYSLSRLARSVRDTLEIAASLEGAGADLVSLSEKIDTTSAAGRMVFRMLAVLSEFERDLTSERTRAALAHKRAKGEAYGETPFGYRRTGDRLEVNPDAAGAVDLVRALREQGWSYRAIAAELEARGVQTAKGATHWDPRTVQRVARRVAA